MKASRLVIPWLILVLAVRAGTVVHFSTAVGDVDVELYDQEKPITVDNFLRYVTANAFAGTFFHRAVHNFAFQGGGYAVTQDAENHAFVVGIPELPAITNEFAVGPFRSNVAGTIAMAKTSDPNSATSEFFFNLKDNPNLDEPANSGGFTVFGRVISGMATLTNWNTFMGGPPTRTNIIVNAGAPFTELPLYQLRTNFVGGYFVSRADFVYVQVSLLRGTVARGNDGLPEIHWGRLEGRTNSVEFSTTVPPQWTVLSNVPPENLGAAMVIDPSGDPTRFYRVKATY